MIFHDHLRFALFSAFLSAGMFLLLHGQRAASADDLAEGERLYQVHCAGCHGPKGEGGRGTVLAAPSLSRASSEGALFNVIARGIPGTEMLGARLDGQQIRQVAAWVRKLGQQPPPPSAGDARRGEQLYLGKGDCASCHAIRTQGGVSGPDLTEIGLRRGSEYLRKALLEPETDVPENFSQYRWHTVIPDNFLQVRVVTKDGRRITGSRLNEDPFSIQLRDLSGRIRSFSKSELAELHKDWGKSFMPSYRGVFSPEELDDVIAFLLSQRGAK